MTEPITIELAYGSVAALASGGRALEGAGWRTLYVHDELDSGWIPFLDSLAEQGETVAVELPGFGASERFEWLESVDDYAYLAADLADKLGADGRLALVGAGLGGWLAVEAVVRGARADALVVIGAPGVEVRGDPPVDYFVLLPEERTSLFFDAPERAPAVDEDRAVRNEGTTARLVWQPRYVNPALARRLHRVRVPTLVLWGENDRFLSRAHGEAIAEGVASGELRVVRESGSFPARENPRATGELVREFIGSRLGLGTGRD